jgi:hypothetical protein
VGFFTSWSSSLSGVEVPSSKASLLLIEGADIVTAGSAVVEVGGRVREEGPTEKGEPFLKMSSFFLSRIFYGIKTELIYERTAEHLICVALRGSQTSLVFWAHTCHPNHSKGNTLLSWW